ncbi:ATP-binding protein [Propionibacteriaceae bacterium G1746]
MTTLLRRALDTTAREALATFPAVVIQGARQVGKSTFAQMLVDGQPSRLITLDDPSAHSAARADPTGFVEQFQSGTLVIDELQRCPELVLPIKASIDRDRRPARFLLTGSSNLLRLPRTPDSLAGRAVTVVLNPLSRGELGESRDGLVSFLRAQPDVGDFPCTFTRSDYVAAIAQGGYPEVRGLNQRMRNLWFDSYLERLMDRDLADIAPRVDPGRISTVLRLLAAGQAGELVKSRIARDASIPETTVTGYLDLLETMYLTTRLPSWTPNLTSREVARPKAFVVDSGLSLRLSRVTEQQLLAVASPHMGAAMEGFVVGELFKQRGWSATEYDLFHYRDRAGLEVDVIVEFYDGSVMGFEVKSGATFKSEHFAGLRVLRDKLGPRFVGGYVLGTSTTAASFGDRLWGLPAAALWQLGSD